MKKLFLQGFKNSPVVVNELVKFLAKNTHTDVIEKLQDDNKALNESIKKLTKTTNEALIAGNGAHTKSENVRIQAEKIKDRVKKTRRLTFTSGAISRSSK